MLVLSRKEGEQILIGDDIVLTINWISGNRVSIGIEAPRKVKILRSEIATDYLVEYLSNLSSALEKTKATEDEGPINA